MLADSPVAAMMVPVMPESMRSGTWAAVLAKAVQEASSEALDLLDA